MHRLLAALALLLASGLAHADGDAVALLPLDADKSLELYGQPVASEIAKALVQEHVDVVVVGPKQDVPQRARLIVDGTISGGKGSEPVHLQVRIRERATAATLSKLSADAPSLTSIDSAAAHLAVDVLHSVQEQLAKKPAQPPPVGDKPVETPAKPAAPTTHSIKFAVAAGPLQELKGAASDWATQHHWTEGADAEATVQLDPVSYEPVEGKVPMARARVRVRISAGKTLKFDRVVVTDTVVGEKAIPPAQLAARVAREVLAIVEPHMQRTITSWK